jgi:hypothetical protein
MPPIRLLGLRALHSAGGEPPLPADSVRPFTSAVHLPVRPWSPRSQGFPRDADAARTEAPRRPAVTSGGRLSSAAGCDQSTTPSCFASRGARVACAASCGMPISGVFVPPADHAGGDAPPAFLPARPITPADLAALTERVRRRVIRFLQAISPARRRSRRRGSIGIGITASLRPIRSSGPPSLRSRSATSASGNRPRPAGMGAMRMPRAAATLRPSPSRTTPRGLHGRNCWPGWGRSFRSSARTAAATSG